MNTDFSVRDSYGDLFSDALFDDINEDLTTLEGLLETTFDAFVGSLDLTGPALVEASEDAARLSGEVFRAISVGIDFINADSTEEFLVGLGATALAAAAVNTSFGAAGLTAPLLQAISVVLATYFAGKVAQAAFDAQEAYNDRNDDPYEFTVPDQLGINEGIEVTALSSYFFDIPGDGIDGRHEGIVFSYRGLTSGEGQDDIDVGVAEVLRLTPYGDRLNVANVDLSDYDTWRFLDDQFIIDMAGGVDTVIYPVYNIYGFGGPAGGILAQKGVFWYDGETHDAGSISSFLVNFAGSFSANGLANAPKIESFLPDDDLIVTGVDNVILTDLDDRFVFTGEDYAIHSGTGKIEGRDGDDILVVTGAVKGDILVNSGAVSGDVTADNLILDGGEDDDWVWADGGTEAITVGGLGRDWVYNTSKDGVIWGDIQNSFVVEDGKRVYLKTVIDSEGNETKVEVEIADDSSNADNFWFAKDVILMDPQESDRLKYYGLALIGGDTTLSTLALAASAFFSPLAGLAVSVGAGAAVGARLAQGKPLVYYDRFVPGVTYMLEDQADGTQDLLVGDVSNLIWKFLDREDFYSDSAEALRGVMRIKGFDRGPDRFFSRPGDLGIALDDFDPSALLAQLAIFAAGVPLAQSYVKSQSILALGLSTALVGLRFKYFAKESGWRNAADPLVIDLDGDGIETLAAGDATVFFDVDGDFFRERTGWLKSDEGFLVIDSNGNGRIDDISEMFANQFEGGFAELASLDSNGDGRITVADALWAELRVWQDFDYDGETDAGELTSLDALGITEIDLASTALNATTPQGTELLSYADVTFADGSVSTMYEAIFAASETITRYAGESGLPAWQGSTLDAKGLGSITDLSVAMANDPDFAELAQSTADAMVTPVIRTLAAQAGEVLGQWGSTQELTRELYAVRLSADGTQLLERSEWDGRALAAANDNDHAWREASLRWLSEGAVGGVA